MLSFFYNLSIIYITTLLSKSFCWFKWDKLYSFLGNKILRISIWFSCSFTSLHCPSFFFSHLCDGCTVDKITDILFDVLLLTPYSGVCYTSIFLIILFARCNTVKWYIYKSSWFLHISRVWCLYIFLLYLDLFCPSQVLILMYSIYVKTLILFFRCWRCLRLEPAWSWKPKLLCWRIMQIPNLWIFLLKSY